MALGVWQNAIADRDGRLQAAAAVSVLDSATQAVVDLFATRAGTGPLTNPCAADSNGFAQFYAATGKVDIAITFVGSSAPDIVYRDVVLLDAFTDGTYGRWDGMVSDTLSGFGNGRISIEVSDPESGDLLPLFSDRAATKPIGNPFLTSPSGRISFFAPVGRINIVARKGNELFSYDDEIIADVA